MPPCLLIAQVMLSLDILPVPTSAWEEKVKMNLEKNVRLKLQTL